jgi:hypothetical protein
MLGKRTPSEKPNKNNMSGYCGCKKMTKEELVRGKATGNWAKLTRHWENLDLSSEMVSYDRFFEQTNDKI